MTEAAKRSQQRAEEA